MSLNGTSAAVTSCYSGIYGTCNKCDAAGSCICNLFKSGNSDMLAMDRTRWDGIIYVCSVDMRAYYSLWILTAIASTSLGVLSIYALRVHVKIARRMNQQIQNSRVVRICGLVLACCLLDIALCVLKIAEPTQLVGIDLAPSFLFNSHQALVSLTVATHSFHLTAAALSTQETMLGRTRTDEALLREAWDDYMLTTISSIIFAIPSLEAVISAAGKHSEMQQKILLVTTIIGTVCSVAANTFQKVRRTNYMLSSYGRSIEELQASLIIARGGISQDTVNNTSLSGPNASTLPKPPHIIVIETDIKKLKSARRNVEAESKQIVAGVVIIILAYAVFLIPKLWNQYTYLVSITDLLSKVALHQTLRLHLPKRNRRTARNAAQDGQLSGSTSAAIVQSV